MVSYVRPTVIYLTIGFYYYYYYYYYFVLFTLCHFASYTDCCLATTPLPSQR